MREEGRIEGRGLFSDRGLGDHTRTSVSSSVRWSVRSWVEAKTSASGGRLGEEMESSRSFNCGEREREDKKRMVAERRVSARSSRANRRECNAREEVGVFVGFDGGLRGRDRKNEVGGEGVVEGAGLHWIGVGGAGGADIAGAVAEGGVGWRSPSWALVGGPDARRVDPDSLETVGSGRRPQVIVECSTGGSPAAAR